MALDPQKAITQYKLDIWGVERGFVHQTVYAIHQTRDGYIWLGTLSGLVRFDGIGFNVFSTDNTGELKDNDIRAIYEDRNGILWIGTMEGGLSCLKAGKFTTYSQKECRGLKDIAAIFEDRAGRLWIGTLNNGLTRFENGKFTTYTVADGLASNRVRAFYQDEDGRLWIATSAGLSIRGTSGRFTCYVGDKGRFDRYIICLLHTKSGELWIGCLDGLYCLKDGVFTYYGRNEGLPNPKIKYLYEDSQRNLWAGTDGGGLIRIKDGRIETFAPEDGLTSGYVFSIHEDREGSLWISTLKGGLHRLRDVTITPYTTREGLSHDIVKCISEDRMGNLWIGTEGGVNRLKDGKLTLEFTTRQGLLNNVVNSIIEDNEGYLWIGTKAGLNRYKDGRLKSFDKPDGFVNKVLQLLIDKKGGLWILKLINLSRFYKGKYTVLISREEISEAALNCFCLDREGIFWLGTTGAGLFRLKGGKLTRYTTTEGLVHNEVECIYEDKKGILYIGTRGGLSRLAGRTFTNYTTQDGLKDKDVRHILEDDFGRLWLGCRGGILCIDKKELSDFAKGRIEKISSLLYNEQDGMKSSWSENGTKTRDGRLWFTTDKGVVVIDPSEIKRNTLPPPVVIEEVIADGEAIDIRGTGSRGREEAPLIISPGKKRLEFYYTALTFIKPLKVKFKLKLEGYDSDWLDAKNARSTTYTELSPGQYTFKVIACNADGVWNEKGASLIFYLQPYFYQTAWFYFFVGLFFLLSAFSFYRFRVRQLKAREKELGTLVELRTKDLKERNIELEKARQKIQHSKELLEEQSEKLKEMDKIKSRFFANISHEFRTPLTLIMGPLEQRLSLCRDEQDIQEMQMMLRNSRRLLNLVNQLLELARLESGKMKLEASRQNIVPFVKSIVMCFESLADQNKTNLIFHKQEEDIAVYFDPEKLEKIITNLMSNAFKYTPADGKITVSIRKAAVTGRFPCGCVEICVRDTGTGIPADRLPHIFDRFYRVEGGHEHKQKGSGIGLALTKELVDLHHGEIEVKSSCRDDGSRGSEFFLRLPMGKEHLQPEEIVEGAHELHELSRIKQKLLREVRETPRRGEPIRDGIDHEDDFHSTTYTRNRHLPPLAEKSPPGGRGQDNKDESGKQDKPVILVVDDNADVRMYIKSSLDPYFNVMEAADGKEGILRAKEIIPDLIVSDVMMPETDGYELCRTLKQDVLTCHVPIILLTARVSEESVLQGLETGADDYITKPFSTELLAVRVRNLIDLRRQLQLEQKNRMTFQPGEISVSPLDDEFYKKLQDTIETHLSDPDFSVEGLCRVLDMSQATLYRKVHALTGKSPTLFLRSFRIKRAAQLLQANAGSVSDVAVKVGFTDKSYFARCFKEQFHCLPSEVSGTFEETNEKLLRGVQGGSFLEKSPPGRRRQEIILLVEDSEDTRTYIRQSLEPDYHVVEAVDGSEGIARAMEIIPDLVISDIMMPGMDGYELCRLLKQDVRSCHIPIVLLTAKAAEESKIKGLELGADDYITKPFNTRILLARIKNLVQLRSHLQEKRNREMALLPVKISEPEIDREFMKELNAVIEENLEDPDFNVEQLAKKLYMSSATLYRKIQALSGEIPSEYIRSFRLRRAAQLLKEKFGSVTEVAFEVGFNSRTYFTKCFKEKFHQLPSVYMAAESQ